MREKTTQKNGRFKIDIIRDNWKEYLWVFVEWCYILDRVERGRSVRWFMLPVYRQYDRAGWVCWIIPLAPFVLVFVAVLRAFRALWADLIYTIEEWKNWG